MSSDEEPFDDYRPDESSFDSDDHGYDEPTHDGQCNSEPVSRGSCWDQPSLEDQCCRESTSDDECCDSPSTNDQKWDAFSNPEQYWDPAPRPYYVEPPFDDKNDDEPTLDDESDGESSFDEQHSDESSYNDQCFVEQPSYYPVPPSHDTCDAPLPSSKPRSDKPSVTIGHLNQTPVNVQSVNKIFLPQRSPERTLPRKLYPERQHSENKRPAKHSSDKQPFKKQHSDSPQTSYKMFWDTQPAVEESSDKMSPDEPATAAPSTNEHNTNNLPSSTNPPCMNLPPITLQSSRDSVSQFHTELLNWTLRNGISSESFAWLCDVLRLADCPETRSLPKREDILRKNEDQLPEKPDMCQRMNTTTEEDVMI
ncbi:uncharacterized protein BO97DRAFT_451770 [Aspergillus homomorphus CBS 101889]|uniref:Uncharacterized protein n=1 Tax=Aspergillus homomorphus (strain CBS 101889) TaxID=1450537 RepID=A0A395HX47_ASPHC|nr:hypothetical protein BO97DRAFT_451770 [Aspergillus homomorphus CBS 101889]RAL12492.1 hypothetical protein BO97DRAFT_451770 [Aspergillus homomorphus CBS 101889]